MIPFHIETHDRYLGSEIAGNSNLSPGLTIKAPGNVILTYQGVLVRKAFGIPEILQFIVDASIDVDIGIFAAWLYDKVKGKDVERIIINRRIVTEITPQVIRQVLEEEIRK